MLLVPMDLEAMEVVEDFFAVNTGPDEFVASVEMLLPRSQIRKDDLLANPASKLEISLALLAVNLLDLGTQQSWPFRFALIALDQSQIA